MSRTRGPSGAPDPVHGSTVTTRTDNRPTVALGTDRARYPCGASQSIRGLGADELGNGRRRAPGPARRPVRSTGRRRPTPGVASSLLDMVHWESSTLDTKGET
ncbi:hypothetical protein GCM10025875_08170 [Litorihabitans aurantiacus]|uniref:Uncharacterized protein n=1 Tax=Litorihabitans aurantiacus TaxID=1930061 RepID=A0AA37XD83_9MICO|nr:hypothetical protein GCM10025875_08170 [Litorihabitans aurantiacus]